MPQEMNGQTAESLTLMVWSLGLSTSVPQRLAEFLVPRSLRIAGVSSCFRRFVEEI